MALGAGAILAVYGVGYARTQGAAEAVTRAAGTVPGVAGGGTAAPATPGTPSATAGSGSGGTAAPPAAGGPGVPAAASATPPSAAASAPAAGASSASAASSSGALRDGSYTATGYGRHGPITASVVVAGGRLVSAAITACGTTFPCSYVSALPGAVVAAQSGQVDFISGATDSSEAYLSAVDQAIAEARGESPAAASAAAAAPFVGGTGGGRAGRLPGPRILTPGPGCTLPKGDPAHRPANRASWRPPRGAVSGCGGGASPPAGQLATRLRRTQQKAGRGALPVDVARSPVPELLGYPVSTCAPGAACPAAAIDIRTFADMVNGLAGAAGRGAGRAGARRAGRPLTRTGAPPDGAGSRDPRGPGSRRAPPRRGRTRRLARGPIGPCTPPGHGEAARKRHPPSRLRTPPG